MSTCLRNATVVLPASLAPRHSVLIVEGRIVWVGPDDSVRLPADVETIDVGGRLVGPGFVDLHCHGGGGVWMHDDVGTAADHHLRHGTTAVLATTVLYPTHEETLAALGRIGDDVLSGRAPSVVGVHMEGPYLHPDLGAYREHSRAVDVAEYRSLPEAARGLLRWMTIAPELPGMAQLVLDLQLATAGAMTFSVGHSRASLEAIRSLVPAGMRMATHLMNATGCAVDPPVYGGTREVGVDEAVLLSDDIVAELIADGGGRHVRPDMLRLASRVKGADGTVLVTDCSAETGAPRGGHVDGDALDVRFTTRGGLAGSALTMDRAVSNIMRHARLGLAEAWRMASYNPAAALGELHIRGQVAPGRRADLVVATLDDDSLGIDQVWFAGRPVAADSA